MVFNKFLATVLHLTSQQLAYRQMQFAFVQSYFVSTQLTTGGAGGKEYDSFQQVMILISFPPVEDNLVSAELSPVKGVNSVLTLFLHLCPRSVVATPPRVGSRKQ